MALEFIQAEVTNEVLNRECVIGKSPFANGVEFTFTGYDYAQQKGVTNGRPVLRFKTSINEPFFASQLFKAKIDLNQNMVAPNGTFNQDLKDRLPQKMTDAEFINQLLNLCLEKGKTIKVDRQTFIGYRYDGSQGYISVLHLNWTQNSITKDMRDAIQQSLNDLYAAVNGNTSMNFGSVPPTNNGNTPMNFGSVPPTNNGLR